jgi:hypothetical protein
MDPLWSSKYTRSSGRVHVALVPVDVDCSLRCVLQYAFATAASAAETKRLLEGAILSVMGQLN